MRLNNINIRKSINKAFLKVKPNRTQIENFKTNILNLYDQINESESEEYHKNIISKFLTDTYYSTYHYINTKGRTDLVIHNGKNSSSTVGVLIETKKPSNKSEMPTKENLNAKALQELILYYLRERISGENIEVKHLIVTNIHEWFIFNANDFDRLFAQNKKLVKQFTDFEEGRLADTKTDFFYKHVAEPFLKELDSDISFTHLDIRNYEKIIKNNDKQDDNKLVALFKLFSPENLLKLPFANDSNSLDKGFYTELLHSIGLQETKEGSKKLIGRKPEKERNAGSLIENAVTVLKYEDCLSQIKASDYGKNQEEQLYNVALELVITWINRVLFLKLLEGQLVKYHSGVKTFKFLNIERIPDFDSLNKLFFQVLAIKESERNVLVKKKFSKIPYLNSSLFEPTELERKTIRVSNLEDEYSLPILSTTVLKEKTGKRKSGELKTLQYLFEFLDSYDFASEGAEEIQEENKRLINASVLGLIFEKINGYKDGSFFTPGFITMYMCHETIRRAVVQKFNETKNWNCKTLDDVYNKIENKEEANKIINDLKVCDPAVGSGHFLVSALNEIIAIKNDLRILSDRDGKRLKEYQVEVVNDELVITDEDGELFDYNPKNKESQRIQETLFNEKQTIIENCLFGVDINPNSVKICRLRLWIELLKNAYYKCGIEELETLPNIDINIKCGNSLISRFDLDTDLKRTLRKSESRWTVDSYRIAVASYRHAESKEHKHEMERLINEIKTNLRSEVSQNDPKIMRLRKLNGELFTLINQGQLFELSKKDKIEWNKKITKLTEQAQKLEKEIEEIKNNKIYKNAFEWRFEFPEVLNDDGDFIGFDVVIGNPPYGVKAQPNEKGYFKDNYQGIIGKYDSYGFFIEKGINILNNNGQFGYIIPHTWLTVLEAQKIRDFLLSNCRIIEINQLPAKVFEDATVETTNLFLKKIKISSDYSVKVLQYNLNSKITQIEDTISETIIPIDIWKTNGVFNLKVGRHENAILDKLHSDSVKLNEICELSVGIQAYDKYAGQKSEIIENRVYHSDIKKDETFVKELNGKEVGRYIINWSGDSWVSYGSWLAHPRQNKFFDQERILVREITAKGKYSIVAGIVNEYMINYKSILNIISRDLPKYPINLKYILGLINSSLFSWLFNTTSNKIVTNTFPRISIYDLKEFPIKLSNQDKQTEIISLVEKILLEKSNDVNSDTTNFESQIDSIIYELYGLNSDEVKIVKDSFK